VSSVTVVTLIVAFNRDIPSKLRAKKMTYEEIQAKEVQSRIEWIFNIGMSNVDVIPDWVWMAAIEKFEKDNNLPSESINAKNFPSLNKRNTTAPTLEEIKLKVL
jgi:hypothetical protein